MKILSVRLHKPIVASRNLEVRSKVRVKPVFFGGVQHTLLGIFCIFGCAHRSTQENDNIAIIRRYVESNDYDRYKIISEIPADNLTDVAEEILKVEQDTSNRMSVIYRIAKASNNANRVKIDKIILSAIFSEDAVNIKAGEIHFLGMVSPGQHHDLLWYLAYDSHQEIVIRQNAINALGFSTDKETQVKLVELLSVVKEQEPLVRAVLQSLARMAYRYEITNDLDVISVADRYYSVGESHAPLHAMSAYMRLIKDKRNSENKAYKSGMQMIRDRATDEKTLKWVVAYAIGLEESLGPAPPDDPILTGYLKIVLSDALGTDFSGLSQEDWKRQLQEVQNRIVAKQYRWTDEEKKFVLDRASGDDLKRPEKQGK